MTRKAKQVKKPVAPVAGPDGRSMTEAEHRAAARALMAQANAMIPGIVVPAAPAVRDELDALTRGSHYHLSMADAIQRHRTKEAALRARFEAGPCEHGEAGYCLSCALGEARRRGDGRRSGAS